MQASTRILHLGALFCLLAPAAAQAQAEEIEERCTEYLWELFEAREYPGCSAALVLPDGEVVAVYAGYADIESEREMGSADRLLSGSIGKTYVTAAAHHLVSVDKLELDAKVSKYLGGSEWYARLANAEAVTVRQLMRHQSGIPRYVFKPGFFAACLAERDRVWKPEELLAYVLDDEPLHAPGAGWAYSDTNYILVGMIIEKVSGQAFYDYVQEHLLKPHGLADTVPSDSRRIEKLTQGYVRSAAFPGMPERIVEDGVFHFNPQFEWCGGGYASTASDLARWAHVLYRGEAFEGGYLESMLDGIPVRQGASTRYGLGVFLRETELGPLHGHDGVMTGYTATMGYFPEHGIAVALMLNTDDAAVLGMPLHGAAQELVRMAVEVVGK